MDKASIGGVILAIVGIVAGSVSYTHLHSKSGSSLDKGCQAAQRVHAAGVVGPCGGRCV